MRRNSLSVLTGKLAALFVDPGPLVQDETASEEESCDDGNAGEGAGGSPHSSGGSRGSPQSFGSRPEGRPTWLSSRMDALFLQGQSVASRSQSLSGSGSASPRAPKGALTPTAEESLNVEDSDAPSSEASAALPGAGAAGCAAAADASAADAGTQSALVDAAKRATAAKAAAAPAPEAKPATARVAAAAGAAAAAADARDD